MQYSAFIKYLIAESLRGIVNTHLTAKIRPVKVQKEDLDNSSRVETVVIRWRFDVHVRSMGFVTNWQPKF